MLKIVLFNKNFYLFSTYLKGIIAIKIAFSCTCHPNKNDESAHKTIHLKKFVGCLLRVHNFIKAGNIITPVNVIVTSGVTLGKTS